MINTMARANIFVDMYNVVVNVNIKNSKIITNLNSIRVTIRELFWKV